MSFVISLNPIAKLIQSFLTPAEQANQTAVDRNNLREYRHPCAQYSYDQRCKDPALQGTPCGSYCKELIMRDATQLVTRVVQSNSRLASITIYHGSHTYYSSRGMMSWQVKGNARHVFPAQHIIKRSLEMMNAYAHTPGFKFTIVTNAEELPTKYFTVHHRSDNNIVYQYTVGTVDAAAPTEEEHTVDRLATRPAKPKRQRFDIQTGPMVNMAGDPYEDDEKDASSLD